MPAAYALPADRVPLSAPLSAPLNPPPIRGTHLEAPLLGVAQTQNRAISRTAHTARHAQSSLPKHGATQGEPATPCVAPVCVPRPGSARSRIGRSAGAQGCPLHGRRRTDRARFNPPISNPTTTTAGAAGPETKAAVSHNSPPRRGALQALRWRWYATPLCGYHCQRRAARHEVGSVYDPERPRHPAPEWIPR